MIKYLANKFRRWVFEVSQKYNDEVYNLETIWVTKEDGAVKTYKDRSLPWGRVAQNTYVLHQIQMSMSDDRLNQYLDKALEAVGKKDTQLATAILYNAKETMKLFPTDELLFNLCCVYTVLDGENPKTYSSKWESKKREIFMDENNDLKGFFLGFAFSSMKMYTESSIPQLKERMVEDSEARKLFHSILNEQSRTS